MGGHRRSGGRKPDALGRHVPDPTLAAAPAPRAARGPSAVLEPVPVLGRSVLGQRSERASLSAPPAVRGAAAPARSGAAALAARRHRRGRSLGAGARARGPAPSGVDRRDRLSAVGHGLELPVFPMANALCLVPWVLRETGATRARARRWPIPDWGGGAWWRLGVLVGLQALGGHPETVVHTALLAGLYLVVRGGCGRATWAKLVVAFGSGARWWPACTCCRSPSISPPRLGGASGMRASACRSPRHSTRRSGSCCRTSTAIRRWAPGGGLQLQRDGGVRRRAGDTAGVDGMARSNRRSTLQGDGGGHRRRGARGVSPCFRSASCCSRSRWSTGICTTACCSRSISALRCSRRRESTR